MMNPFVKLQCVCWLLAGLSAQQPEPNAAAAAVPPESRLLVPADTPVREDLVFCAIGNTGKDPAIARQLAEQIAKLAATGPLDFVLLLGNVFDSPVTSATDPSWQTQFEQLFDARRLPVPFYVAPGELEYQRSMQPLVDYGVFNMRWKMPAHTYRIDLTAHGQPLTLLAVNAPAVIGPISDARTRHATRFLAQTLQSATGWKVAFGHLPLVPCGGHAASPTFEYLGHQIGHWLRDHGPEVYLCVGAGAMEVVPRDSVLHVAVGASGASPAGPAADSLFFEPGAGFAWLRLTAQHLEISLRALDGRVLYTHYVQRQ